MVPQCTTRAAEPVNQVRPLRNTAAAYLEVLVVAWMEEKVCLSIILLERGKTEQSDQKQDLNQRRMYKSKNIRRVGVGFVITRAVHI